MPQAAHDIIAAAGIRGRSQHACQDGNQSTSNEMCGSVVHQS